VLGAVAVVEDLVPDDDAGKAVMRENLAGRYRVVRPFLELLAEAAPLRAVDTAEASARTCSSMPIASPVRPEAGDEQAALAGVQAHSLGGGLRGRGDIDVVEQDVGGTPRRMAVVG